MHFRITNEEVKRYRKKPYFLFIIMVMHVSLYVSEKLYMFGGTEMTKKSE